MNKTTGVDKMLETALKTDQLTKKYKDNTVLNNVDMTVYRGDIYGIIGRNGAGKTAMMKIFTGLTEKTEGEYTIFGKSSKEFNKVKHRIGYLIESPSFYSNLTCYQNLKYHAIQKGIADLGHIDEIIETVRLTKEKDKKFRRLSLGMKQRLGIALALLDDPDLVLLDEPINGIDPIGISEMRETFRKLNHERNMTFIISSHILSELYNTANRFLFIDHGKVLKEMTKQQLDNECRRCIVVKVSDSKKTSALLDNKLGITDYKVTDNNMIRIYNLDEETAFINRYLVNEGIEVSAIYESGVDIEEYFKSLVGADNK